MSSLEQQIAARLTREGQKIAENMNHIVREESDRLLAKIKADSPVLSRPHKGKVNGKYRRSWYITTAREFGGSDTVFVRNKQHQLVHLLEKGHANRDGSQARAIPHVTKNADDARKVIHDRIKNEVTK